MLSGIFYLRLSRLFNFQTNPVKKHTNISTITEKAIPVPSILKPISLTFRSCEVKSVSSNTHRLNQKPARISIPDSAMALNGCTMPAKITMGINTNGRIVRAKASVLEKAESNNPITVEVKDANSRIKNN